MIIQEMFKNINYENVWNVMYENYFKHRNYTRFKLFKLKRHLKHSVKEIIKMKNKNSINDSVFIIDFTYDDLPFEESICEKMLDNYCYKKEDILNKFKIDEIVEKNIDVSKYSYEKFLELLHNRPHIPSYSAEFCPWEDVIFDDIWDGSIKEFGIDTCAASILYEITFSGYKNRQIKKRQKKLLKRMKPIREKVIKIKTDNKNDNKKNNDISDELKEDLRKSFIIAHKNYVSIYYKMKNIYEELLEGN